MDKWNLLEEIRFWELQPWQGTIQVRGEVQEDLLGESDGCPPTTKAGSHCTSTQSIQRSAITSPKLLRKIFGKACHEFGQQADSRRLLQVKPVAIVVPGLSMTSCSSSSSGTSPPTSLPQESTGSTRIPALIECESAEEQARRDQSRNPTKKLRVHDKYGETRYSSFDFFQKYRRHGMLIRTEQVFNVT